MGSPCCDDCCCACKTAVVAASPDVVVAWLLPRDFGGSHDYVSLWPEGYVHLTVGSEVNSFLEQDGRQVVELPFTLRLDSFRIEY